MLLQAQFGGMMGAINDVKFVGATTRSGSGVISWPAGAEVGDYALILVPYNDVTTLSGYASHASDSSGSFRLNLHHKQLDSADLASPPTIPAAFDTVHVLVYRGVAAGSVRGYGVSGSIESTLNISGFSKSGGCRAIVNATIDRNGGGAIGSPPSYMQTRSSSNAAPWVAVALADVLLPANYPDGAAFAWTGFDAASNYPQAGFAVELI